MTLWRPFITDHFVVPAPAGPRAPITTAGARLLPVGPALSAAARAFCSPAASCRLSAGLGAAAGGGEAGSGPEGTESRSGQRRRWREEAAGTEAAGGAEAGASAEAEEVAACEAAAGSLEAGAAEPALGWKKTAIQRPMEKRMMSKEIFLEERLSPTGIAIKILKRRSMVKVENLSGAQTSVSS